MSLMVAFRAVAQAEFVEAAAWYESQRVGLGFDFISEVEQILQVISESPDRYPSVDGAVREAPIARFPYCIYYRTRQNDIEVIAVFHSSRDPSLWQMR